MDVREILGEKTQFAQTRGGNESPFGKHSSVPAEGPEPSLLHTFGLPQLEKNASLPPLSNEFVGPVLDEKRSYASSSDSAGGPPGRLNQIPPGVRSEHGRRGGSAQICAETDFGNVHATTHGSEHGGSGGFAQICANLDDGPDRFSPIDENLNFGDLSSSNLDTKTLESVQIDGGAQLVNSGILVTTSQDVSVMVLHQALDFEIRGEDLILNKPIENVAQMNALYAAIMSSTGDEEGVLRIGAPPPVLTIEGGDGHSELAFTNVEGEDASSLNPRNPPSYTEKREREVASSDSELSPKRTNFGEEDGDMMEIEGAEGTPGVRLHPEEPMAVDCQSQEPREGDFDWYGWVEQELGGFGIEMRGIHEAVSHNGALVQNFMQDVQTRVDTALSTYERAIFTEFSSSNIKNEELKCDLVNEFRTASIEIQKEARSAVMEMFTSKAIESGHLWRGLVEAQSKNHEQSLQKSIGEVRVALEATIEEKVVEVMNTRGVAQVDWRFHEIKGWFVKEMGGLAQSLDCVRGAQRKMETLLGAHVESFTNFREETQQRVLALNQGIVLCMKQFKKGVATTPVLESNPAVSSLREEVKNLSHGITADNHGRDYRDGKMSQKLEDLAKMFNDMRAQVNMQQGKPPSVIVVPPPMVSITGNSVSGPGRPEPAVLGSPIEIIELEPLPGGVHGFEPSVVAVQEALLQCVDLPPVIPGGGGRREIQVCPVEANSNVATTGGLNLLNLPIATHLSRSQVAPKFSGKKEDWTSFWHKFNSWVRVISSGRVLGDQENLLLLNSCIPEYLQKEMQLWEREKNRMPTYVEFRAHLEAKFGRAQSENMRKKWMDVHMPRSYGKIGIQQFDEFRVNFKLALADVLDVTPEETRRVLCEKLVPFMRKWVIEAEAKKRKYHPLVELDMKEGLSARPQLVRGLGSPR